MLLDSYIAYEKGELSVKIFCQAIKRVASEVFGAARGRRLMQLRLVGKQNPAWPWLTLSCFFSCYV